MLPSVDAVYPAAKALFWPGLRYGLRWTIEGTANIPVAGPLILASNHVSYLDPLTLGYVAAQQGRRVRFLAKAELFDKPGLGPLLRGAHQIPVNRGQGDAVGALSAAVAALAQGECVAVFPEGTISLDLEPMRAKSGTARLALESGAPVVPVGLWGTHRILMKGRRPDWQWGVAEVAVVGEPVVLPPDARVKDASVSIMDAIIGCVARARALYPQCPEAGEDAWWWRAPDTAGAHRSSA